MREQQVGTKAVIVAALVAVLCLVILLLRLVIFDRQTQAQVAANDIAASWGAEQLIAGPFMKYALTPNDEESAKRLLPWLLQANQSVTADVNLNTQVRKRGVHDVTVYTAQLRLDADPQTLQAPHISVPFGHSLTGERQVALFVRDVTGLEGLPKLSLGTQSLAAQTMPGFGGNGGTWLMWTIPEGADLNTLTIDARLRGVRRVSLMPGGLSNELTIKGDWPHPSFDGARLPDRNEVTKDGFVGRWSVSALALGLPHHMTDLNVLPLHGSNIGVSLLAAVDAYKLLDRATKYGLMVVALTFLVLFLFEVRGGPALHPIPYLLMGSALVLFFMSVLSLAEHLPFWLAYSLSVGIIIAMISSYARAVLATTQQVATLSACLAGLYGLLYSVLNLQDLAMLGGTALLLSALGGTMYLTRDIEWYSLERGER